MKRYILMTVLISGIAAAATQSDRIIRFESKSFQGDLRNGPYTYNGNNGAPVNATVSNLKITSMRAVLSAPTGMPITSAQGQRTADFSGGVTVTRNRLTAKGPSLTYAEASGFGTLKGGASAVYAPEAKDGDPVDITADNMGFDVDTNTSKSSGNVKLVTGTQTGTSTDLTFDENRDLGLLTGNVQMNRAAKGKQKALTITGTEARVLTKTKLLYVKGGVKLVSGDTTTTGDAMYYDDKKDTAVVVGSPAKSVNARQGTTVSAGTIEQRTDIGRVRQLSGGYKIPVEQFKLTTEK